MEVEEWTFCTTLERKSTRVPRATQENITFLYVLHFWPPALFSHENITEAGSLKTASPKLKTDVLALESYHLRHKGQYDLRGTVKLCHLGHWTRLKMPIRGWRHTYFPFLRWCDLGQRIRSALELTPTLWAHPADSTLPSPIQFLSLEAQARELKRSSLSGGALAPSSGHPLQQQPLTLYSFSRAVLPPASMTFLQTFKHKTLLCR